MMGNHVPSAVTENVVGFLLCYLPKAYVLCSSMSTLVQSSKIPSLNQIQKWVLGFPLNTTLKFFFFQLENSQKPNVTAKK